MKERRKSPRISIRLEIELRRGQWERHVTEDVSRRGLFVRISGPCAIRQLMQIRVRLPGELGILDMMARVARRDEIWPALASGRMPGLGLEFFHLDEAVVGRWDWFVEVMEKLGQAYPNLDAWSFSRLVSRIAAKLHAGELTTQPSPPRRKESSFIYRPGTADRLQAFLDEELSRGTFELQLPYEVDLSCPANLRVIHPASLEEFVFPGKLEKTPESEIFLLRFEPVTAPLRRQYVQFMQTGEAPRRPS